MSDVDSHRRLVRPTARSGSPRRRGGLAWGDVTVGAWASGRMPSKADLATGVGDRAVWVPDLKELVATKNNVLCDIGVAGPPSASESSDVVRRRLGEACNKIFAKP